MSEVPPGCGPHRKAASFRLSPIFSIEQMFASVKNLPQKSSVGFCELLEKFIVLFFRRILDFYKFVFVNRAFQRKDLGRGAVHPKKLRGKGLVYDKPLLH